MGVKPDKVKKIMNLKNSIYKLSFAAMIMMAMNATDLQAQSVVPAQKGEKTFTLEDLNFGGNNYRNMVAKNRWCTWWGNELVRQDVDACYLVNKTTGKETKLFGIHQPVDCSYQGHQGKSPLQCSLPFCRQEHRDGKQRQQDLYRRLQEA